MIYLTQLIYIKEGKETEFHEFEDLAIPLMSKYNGRIIHRIRPPKECFIDNMSDSLPYEVHFLSFDSEEDFSAFMKDDSRIAFMHLKEASIKASFLVKGEKL